ncbi:MAG TPA: MDR family MFS transporter [Frankiaceae bacterium]|jgi:EmrB/QacA subfamily drug resistance transporter|nr:MDR family MFS transporter [Frankiaceae bacterium]
MAGALAQRPDSAAPPAPDGELAAGEYSHRQILVILSGLILGMFLAALDQTVVSTSIYKIGQSLHGLTAQAWVTTAFLITSTIATPLYGKLSDMYGRKPFFLAAIAIFVVGSAACSFATSMYMLAAFRAFQGIGAGGLFTLALAITGDIIPPRQRAKYQGYFLAVFGTSSVLGPVVGGALAGQDTILGIAGWRWIFLLNVPIGIVALFVINRVLQFDNERHKQRLDLRGAALLVICLVPLLLVAEQGREWGWGSGKALLCFAIGIIALVMFVLTERAAGDTALLPARLFRVRAFSIGAAQSMIIGIGMFGGLTLLPLYLQLVKGNSPTKAGLLTLPLILGLMTGSITSGQVTSRTGHYRIFPIVGSAALVAGMLMLWRLSADSTLVYAGLSMTVVGLGIGMNMQTVVLAMQNAVPPRDIGVSTSSATFFRQMGGTIGVAVYLSIVYSIAQDHIRSAYEAAAKSPAFIAVARAHPDQIAKLRGGGNGALNDTSFLSHFDATLAHPFKAGFTSSLTVAFLVGAAVLVVAFVLAVLQREVPLRTVGAQQAAAEEQAQLAGSL